jgi:hypothetical protein
MVFPHGLCFRILLFPALLLCLPGFITSFSREVFFLGRRSIDSALSLRYHHGMSGVKKTILIVTDEDAGSRAAALALIGVFFGKGGSVKAVSGDEFQGTDLLAADFCFFGCAEPAPPSFAYFEKMLLHVNLSLRCGAVFSPGSPAAVRYLVELVADSGIKLKGSPFIGSGLRAVQSWALNIMQT